MRPSRLTSEERPERHAVRHLCGPSHNRHAARRLSLAAPFPGIRLIGDLVPCQCRLWVVVDPSAERADQVFESVFELVG